MKNEEKDEITPGENMKELKGKMENKNKQRKKCKCFFQQGTKSLTKGSDTDKTRRREHQMHPIHRRSACLLTRQRGEEGGEAGDGVRYTEAGMKQKRSRNETEMGAGNEQGGSKSKTEIKYE